MYISILSRAAYLINLYKIIYICLKFQNCYLFYYYIIVVYKNQVLNFKEFFLSIYIIANYYNIYTKFVSNLIQIENLENFAYYFVFLIKKK